MAKRIQTTVLSSLLCLLLAGCGSDAVYSHFADVPAGGWDKDSVYAFDYPIADSTACYQILLYVRHTEVYPYQNMWLFVGDGSRQDTIEFYLANDRGEWLGNGKSGIIEMPVLYEERVHFEHGGEHRITLQHGMREERLKGIASVGVEIIRNDELGMMN